MKIPKSFNEFTVRQFMSWHEIQKENISIVEREYKLLSMLLGISVDECEGIPFKTLTPLMIDMNKIHLENPSEKVKQVIRVNGRYYMAITEPKYLKECLTTAQYTAFKEYTREDAIKNMDKILPLIYCPYRFLRKPKISDKQQCLTSEFLNAKIGDVFGAVFFYARLWVKLNPILQSSLEEANRTIRDRMREISQAHGVDFDKVTDGTTS